MGKIGLTMGCIPYGTVYLVDRGLSLKEKIRDLENIKKLDFNTVVLWPSVSRWDASRPGGTAFKSIDEVMDMCAKIGLKAVLELQGQNTSNQEAPESFLLHDGKPQLNNPAYRHLTTTYMREVAAHFKGHPALLAYDIYNEIGYNSDDIHTRREFARFLEKKYIGDIASLNELWGTYFTTFPEIADLPPSYNAQYRVWLSGVPQRDWLEFRPYNWELLLDEWTAAIRGIDPDVVILADALGSDTIHERSAPYFGATDWQIAEHVQVLGLSCWANMLGPKWREQDVFRWPQFWRGALSAARGKQVIVSELMTQNRTMFPQEGSSMTDQIRLWSYQVIFNGIQGLIYWKYRPFRNGLQVAGRGLTDFEANPNKHGLQAAEVAAFTKRHAVRLAGARPDNAGCAILHDHNVQNIYAAIHGKEGFYTDANSGMFRGFWTNGVSPAFVRPQDMAAGVPEWIKVLAVPCNVSVSAQTAGVLTAFLKRGGTLLTESRFGLLNENATLWERVPAGGMADLGGFKEIDFTCLYEGSVTVGSAKLTFTSDYFQFLKLGKKVRVLQKTSSGDPAFLVTSVGKGVWLHVPYIISHKVQNSEPGALDMFREIFKLLVKALCPVVPLLKKDPCVDVSVLTDADSRPYLIGISNFEHKTSTVELVWNKKPLKVEGGHRIKMSQKAGVLSIAIGARDVAAVFV